MDFNASFEDEILVMNPDLNLIYNGYEGPNGQMPPPPPWETRPRQNQSKMKIISKMNQIIGSGRLGHLPTHRDWDESDCVEKETIAMMRRLGMDASSDQPTDETRTISTMPVNDDMVIMRNGNRKMPIFMSNSYFELRPRVEATFGEDDDQQDATPTDSTYSEFSDDVNLYQPIPLNTTNETVSTTVSASEDDSFFWKQRKSTVNQPVTLPQYTPRSTPPWLRPREPSQTSSNSRDSSRSSSSINTSDLNNRRSKGSSTERKSPGNWRDKESKPQKNPRQKKNNNWRNPYESSFNERDENNWRLNKTVAQEPDSEQQPTTSRKYLASTKDRPTTSRQYQRAATSQTTQPREISNCGSPLFKPKELFLKKKAMMIQKVFAQNKST